MTEGRVEALTDRRHGDVVALDVRRGVHGRAWSTEVTETTPGRPRDSAGPSLAFGAEPRSPALATTSAPFDVA